MNECHGKKKLLSWEGLSLALGLAFALSFVLVIAHYMPQSNGFWMLFAALMMGQTSKGAPLTMAARYFLLILLAYVLVYSLVNFIPSPIVIYMITAIVFVLSGTLLFVMQPAPIKTFFMIMLIAFVFMLAVLNIKLSSLHNDIWQILLGAIIALVSYRLFMPMNFFQQFKQGVLPILDAYYEYTKALSNLFDREKAQPELVARKRWLLEKVMQSEPGSYPEWIFEIGFNPGLRGGYRYFLLQLDKIGEVLFSLNYLAFQPINPELLATLKKPLALTWQKNEDIIKMLQDYFTHNTIGDIHGDFTSDVTELENTLRKVIPKTLELLDISPDYVSLTAIVRDIKDLRELLLQAVMALPNTAFIKPADIKPASYSHPRESGDPH